MNAHRYARQAGLWLAWLVLGPLTLPPVARAEVAPLDFARQRAARVLGVRPEQIVFTAPADQGDWVGWRVPCAVQGQEYWLSLGPSQGIFKLSRTQPSRLTGPDLGLSGAQRQARAIIARAFADCSHLRVTQAMQATPGWYSFAWREKLGPEVYTGTTVSLLAHRSGLVCTYNERIARPVVKANQVKITRERARQIALRSLPTKRAPEAKLGPLQGELILSSLFSPTRGPVWQFTGRQGTFPVMPIVIDAMNGRRLK